MNSPFYKQPWFIPVSVLIVIIICLQIMPSPINDNSKFKPDEIRQFVQVLFIIIITTTLIVTNNNNDRMR